MNNLNLRRKAVKGQFISSNRNGNPRKKNFFLNLSQLYCFIKCNLYSEINFLRDKFLNLQGIEFHIFTPENLVERCKQDVEKCGKK